MKSAALLLVVIFAIAGCVQQTGQITEITLPGHPVYTFSADVRDSLKYPVSDKEAIRQALLGADKINIIFDGSDAEDNKYFQVVLYNLVTKMQTFFVYEGKIVDFRTYYFIGDQWYNSTGGTIAKPEIEGASIWVKGPNTGGIDNSIIYFDNKIYLQGTTYGNLTLAGDKLALIVLGVERV